MSDILLAMREFRALDDKRRLGGLTAEEEFRWLDLRATVKGDGPVPLGRIPLVPGAKGRPPEAVVPIEPVRSPPVKAEEAAPAEVAPPEAALPEVALPEVAPPEAALPEVAPAEVAPPEVGPQVVPVWTAPEFLPFEVSRITYLPEVDEEAIAEGFATLPPEGEVPVEKTFGPGQPMQVPWEASQVEQPFPSLEPTLDPPAPVHDSAESTPALEGFGPGAPDDPLEFVPPHPDLDEEPQDDSAEFVHGISLADLLDPAPFHDPDPSPIGDGHDSAESWGPVEGIPLDDLLDSAEFSAPVEGLSVDDLPDSAEPIEGIPLDDLPPDDPVELSLDDLIEEADPAADFVSGTHRVVVHTRGGVVKRGHLEDTALAGPTLALQTQSGAIDTLATDQLQVIFFMRDPQSAETSRAASRTIRVIFPDGRPLQGTVDGPPEGPGFFLIPADTRGNTSRIWVYRDAVRDIVLEPT